MITGCRSDDPLGLHNYFVYAQGRGYAILGNSAANSLREHIVRMAGADFLLAFGNDFTNLDRREVDPKDAAKSTFNIQKGRYATIAGNKSSGAWGTGPLGGRDGAAEPDAAFEYVVYEDNVGDTMFEVEHGTRHGRFESNTIRADDASAIRLDGFDRGYQRGVVDFHILDNLALNQGPTGRFLSVEGDAAELVLVGNVYVAPNLKPGSHVTAAVEVRASDLSAFTRIGGNTWPDTRQRNSNFAGDGVFYIGTWDDPKGYKTVEWWKAQRQVAGDVVKDVERPAVEER
jgi:hypothetical protein